MNVNKNKLAKTERPYPPHKERKVKERRKYSVCVSNRTSGKSRTSSVDSGTFETEFGMQMIAAD